MKIISKIAKSYTNLRCWNTDKKIIVIESDDWGTIRMPDMATLNRISKKNKKVLEDRFSMTDTIARKADLEELFNVLLRFKDYKGNSPVITANTIVANPNFKKIKENGFQEYYFEEFYKTIGKLPDSKQILSLWKTGMSEKIFKPQLHGREHLHVPLWLEELKLGNKDLLDAFEEECFSVPYTSILKNKRKNLMSALDLNGLIGEEVFQEKYLKEGASIFKDYFGYTSKSFIAPAYIWHPKCEKVMKYAGIEYLQGLPLQYIPSIYKKKFSKKLHYTGQRNKHQQYYITRNVFFEPASNRNKDWVNIALNRIEDAFNHKRPVIIGSHRINFIGSLNQQNRDDNLIMFSDLLTKILKKWPNVEFMTTEQLGDLINKSYSNLSFEN